MLWGCFGDGLGMLGSLFSSLWFRLGHFDGGTGAKSKPERLLMIFKLSGYPAEIFKHETLLVSRSLFIKG